MSDRTTLEEVEQQVIQLPVSEQLKLVARICEQLSITTIEERNEERVRREHLAQVDAWLAECDAVAENIGGKFDAAEDIRQIREERTNR